VVGQYREGGAPAPAPAPQDLIGADEEQAAAQAMADIAAADTIPLDEKTLREIFGNEDEEDQST
jgi:hypothetical protein